MKKIATLFSVMALSALVTACGTAGTNNLNDPRALNLDDRNVYDVNYNDVNDVYDGGRNRTFYMNRTGDSPFVNDPEVTDYDRRIMNGDRDDRIFDDEEMTQRTRNLTR